MDLICYLHPGWEPLVRPAPATRAWMDATPEAFAYRCLPLNIANAHGWEILCPCDATVYWNGGLRTQDVTVQSPRGSSDAPVSLFGQGVLTFHIQALFRTPPGWDLWVGGSPNLFKSGIAPLTGVVEADWSPYTFTMNWKFTRRNHWVSFRRNEPICFIFPVQRHALERMEPKFVRLTEDSAIAQEYQAWSRSRTEFQATMADGQPRLPADKWQKRYYRGVGMHSETPAPGHRTRMRLEPFVHAAPAAPAVIGDLNEERLGRLLVAVARAAAGRQGADAFIPALAAAGLPDATVARLASDLAAIPLHPTDQ